MSEEFKKPDTMSWDEHLKAGMDGLKDEMRDSLGAGDTISNVRKHSRTAMKEALLAWRSLIDGAIERIDKTKTEAPNAKRVTKIKIE
jgi:hypothetical protein